MIVRSAYNYDRGKLSDATALVCVGSGRTVQDEKDEADINVIMRRFGVTGQLPSVAVPPSYGDFSLVGDFREALELVRMAEDSFMALPWETRKRFEFDPAKFVDFCSDRANLEDMRKMGLAVPATVVDTPVVPAVPA